MSIAIVDYGMGNLRSVENAFLSLSPDVRTVHEPQALSSAEKIVLPGVGAFGDGMARLESGGWISALEEEVRGRRKPFLGLCVGMQVLATTGTEHGSYRGLNWIPGVVDRLAGGEGVRVPHIGWNDVELINRDGLYSGVERPVFYFVHSFVFRPDDPAAISGVCRHGERFAASIERGNIWATQFHPEKSQASGLQVLRNFVMRECESFR
jgi:glutamine amidotransferase